MVPLLLLIEFIKKFLLNKYVLIGILIISAGIGGYIKGKKSVEVKETEQQIKDIVKCKIEQQKLEIAHDKRINKILSNSISDVESERLLSTWPDKTTEAP